MFPFISWTGSLALPRDYFFTMLEIRNLRLGLGGTRKLTLKSSLSCPLGVLPHQLDWLLSSPFQLLLRCSLQPVAGWERMTSDLPLREQEKFTSKTPFHGPMDWVPPLGCS
jgi:hypothetical protein